MFNGSLIEELIATVERAEQNSKSEDDLVCESLITEGLVVLARQNGEYDPNLFWQETGVA